MPWAGRNTDRVLPTAVRITEEPITALPALARIPIAFEVDRVLDAVPLADGSGGFALHERALDAPYRKDYDAEPGNGPLYWAGRFDLARWGLLAARFDDGWIGGAVIAVDTPEVARLEGRHDLAVLWDLRVTPAHRGRGVGAALFRAAEGWAAARGCRELSIETQNINVAACRFYAAQGCRLDAVHPGAYRHLPDEIQLLWYRTLG